jgi:hypothetical protein
MAKTMIADVIVPEVFQKYARERTAVLSAFVQAGIVARDPLFDALAAGGGRTVNLPFWQDATPARQVLDDGGALEVNKITAAADIAYIQNDGQAWSVNDLAKALSGADPMGAVVEQVSGYWARIDQGIMLASLAGVFGAASMAANLLDIAEEVVANVDAASKLTASTFVDATLKLGDASTKLTAIAMHSDTEAALRKADLLEVIPGSMGVASITTFQGRRVIVDDGCPKRAGTTSGTVYRSYLFGEGAFAMGHAPMSTPVQGGIGTEGVEIERNGLAGDTALINRRRFILHPRGVKFTSAELDGASPTNDELEEPTNWVRVWEAKNIHIVAIEHNN